MKLLILGGTQFVGRHMVERAIARGHEVTLFNRGNKNIFPNLETIIGDRDPQTGDGLSALERAVKAGGAWDAVIDVNGYVPRLVRATGELLKLAVKRYVFISSISVYSDLSEPGADENATLIELEDASTEVLEGLNYGGLKVLCERVVEELFSGHAGSGTSEANRALIVRPGLVVGPFDPTDRFTYWPDRIAQGGEIIAPDAPAAPMQFIDARDLADFTLHATETNTGGIFHATSPVIAMQIILEACKTVTGSDARIRYLEGQFLLEQNVNPWMGPDSLPLWLGNDPAEAGFAQLNVNKALEAGLKIRALEETVRDTLAWANTRGSDHEWKSGLTAARETQLLETYKNSLTT
jgi:2'-hydroxyisoflavone reductase